MVDILNANVSFVSTEISRIEPLFMGIGLGILVSSFLWYLYLSNGNQDNNKQLIFKLWL